MSAPSRPHVVAVIGSARCTDDEADLAYELGKALVDNGMRVITGGLGGVMEAACRGARESTSFQPGSTIGILPTYETADANEYCDIVIATGLNHARNVIVVASADVVVAVAGRAGTLSEVSMAWTLGRPVLAVGDSGWAAELAGKPIDDRRSDVVHGPYSPAEAASACLELAANGRTGRSEF